MENEDQLRLASSYAALAASPAYADLIVYLEGQCKKQELLIAQIPVSDNENWHLHFLSWQRLVQVVESIKNIVEDNVNFKIAAEEEQKNERPDTLEYAGSSTQFSGY